MLSKSEAKAIVETNLPGAIVEVGVPYGELYVFRVIRDEEFEANYDGFYSVRRDNGVFSEFSLFRDGDINEITELFLKAETERSG